MMKSRIRASSIVLAGLAISALSGCQGGGIFGDVAGTYTGILTAIQNGQSRTDSAKANVSVVSNQEVAIRLLDVSAPEGEALGWTIHARLSAGGELALSGTEATVSPLPSPDPSSGVSHSAGGENSAEDALQLKQGTDGCFAEVAPPGSASDFKGARLCVDADQISFRGHPGAAGIQAFTLSRNNPSANATLETPANYSLADLIARVKKDNYSNRIEFERYVQAKLNAQQSALDLLPHVNIHDILNIFSFNVATILKSIGDFAPFLFPENWLKAGAARWQARAQEQSYLAMTLDATSIVEGLAYTVIRDQEVLNRLAYHREQITKKRDLVLRREHAGLMQIGSSDDINAVLNSIDENSVILQQSLDSEYATLAQASGFNNPKAIIQVDGVSNDLPDAPVPTVEALIPLVLQAAPELRQMQDLVEAQDLDKKGTYFGWMDPSSSAYGIGFGMGDPIAIAASNLREMELKRDQLKTILAEKTSDAVGMYGQVLSTFQLGTEDAAIQSRRVDRLSTNLTQGLAVVMSDLVSALEGATQADLQVTNAQFNALIAQSRLSRLTLTGLYHDEGENPEPAASPSPSIRR